MSTFLHSNPLTKPIKSIDDLRGYFEMFSKSKGEEKVGAECELFGVNSETGDALPYSGPGGIEAVLTQLAYEFGYETIQEENHVVALRKGGTVISLEPGGQVELSGEPVKSIHEVKAQLDEFIFELKTVAGFIGNISFLACGTHPFSGPKDIEWVPKKRYAIMSHYLGRQGKRAFEMMKCTATNQVNLDYTSQEDAVEKMRLALRLTPIAAAMFATSGFAYGKPAGRIAERLNIWRHTDPERSGLVLNLVCVNCTFEDYLNYVLDVPMMFIVRAGEWIVVKNLTFRKFVEKGYQQIQPTLEDFELHLSTIFTDARFKHYLEIRGMDGQRVHMIPSVYAFWKGILYDDEARKSAAKLVHSFMNEDVLKLHQSIETAGLQAKIHGKRVLDLARSLVKISEKGLENQGKMNQENEDERIYLTPLKDEVLRDGKTTSERIVEMWKGNLRKNKKALVDYLKI